ncbi:phage holin family protein [Paenibacillus lutrae]|uniref:Holin n=1 Tax=Paenibacillus lutrae TaxID=2078573 RepID=A0A7X3FJL3_9BACL|nr:phage holin family protein [Paenibacillus lutrae]MVP00792.1 holin [Paenibacillus lutrae]
MEPFTFKLVTLKELFVYTVPAAVGSFVTYMFGGWTQLLEFLVIVMAIDYATGLIASLKEKQGLNSEVGFWGLIKKTLMLLSVSLGYKIDIALGTDWCMSGCIYFWLANEMISILENYGRMGLPVPPPLKKAITVLKHNLGEKDDKDQGETNVYRP